METRPRLSGTWVITPDGRRIRWSLTSPRSPRLVDLLVKLPAKRGR